MTSPKIRRSALISAESRLGRNVEIGPFSIVHPDVIIVDNSVIGSNCGIGYPAKLITARKTLVIGPNSIIRSHSIFYEGSELGPGMRTGQRVTVRERTKAEIDFQIGTLSDIQSYCEVGDFARF